MSTATENIKQTFVGSLACQRDSFLSKDFETTVLSCSPINKKNQYEVELQDTILFPEGGGQPSDSGRILKEDGEVFTVSAVTRKGLHAIHLVDKPLEQNSRVSVEVDWEKRLDYMQQHTGQHLLSAVMQSKLGLDTVSWSMGGVPTEKKPKIEPYELFNYVETTRKLTVEEINDLSQTVNKYITMEPKDISILEKDPDSHEDFNTSKVPDDYDLSKGVLRVVHIHGLEHNPCCGTHLKNTSQLGSILILPTQSNIRGTNSKLYFMCGDRIRTYTLFANEMLTKSKRILSCSDDQIAEKCESLSKNIQSLTKREQYWLKEVAIAASSSLIASLNKKSTAHLIRDEYGSLEFLLQTYNATSSKLSDLGLTDYCYVLVGREKSTNSGVVIIASDSGDKIAESSTKLASIVSKLKGGGGKKGGKWQGKVLQFTNVEYDALEQLLQAEF